MEHLHILSWLKDDISEAEKQLRLRFLQYLVTGMMVALAIGYVLGFVVTNTITVRTNFIFLAAFFVISFIYSLTQLSYYYLTIFGVFMLGCGMIVLNAATSIPPHLEILFLLVLPLVSALLLSFRETLFWIIVNFIILTIFSATYITPVNVDIGRDLQQIFVVFNVVILFATYQRQRSDTIRQQLAIKNEKAEITQFLISAISHDFRTPVSVMNSSLYLLKQSLVDGTHLKRITKMERQTAILDEMINNISTMSQLNDEIENSLMDCDLTQLVKEAIKNQKRQAEEKSIRINLNVVTDLAPIFANQESLSRIPKQLINNALLYTEAEGQITITLDMTENNNVLMRIADTGIGISKEDLDNILTPFYRADNARPMSKGNNGLGLAIVNRTVEIYGGHIEIQSELGKGTAITVKLPTRKALLLHE